jgi:hypothetical protein
MYINTLNIGKRKEAELYLNRILKDMEKHTPVLIGQKKDLDRVLESHAHLTVRYRYSYIYLYIYEYMCVYIYMFIYVYVYMQRSGYGTGKSCTSHCEV